MSHSVSYIPLSVSFYGHNIVSAAVLCKLEDNLQCWKISYEPLKVAVLLNQSQLCTTVDKSGNKVTAARNMYSVAARVNLLVGRR
jgi:hypothetical protein